MFENIDPTIITFSIYLVVVLGIGVIAYLRTKDFSDYILGGRSFGPVVTALSAGASDMSGWLLMGLPGAIFGKGLSQSWIAIGLIIGAYYNWKLVAGRLRVHTEINNNALTLPDFFHNRFGKDGQLVKTVSAVTILIFFTIYCASGMVAGARLFETLFHMEYINALYLGALATIAYTFIGGFLAVSWSDTIQATLMLFALILTPVMIILYMGGWDAITTYTNEAAIATNISYSSLTHNVSFIAIISAAAWGLGYFGQPHILARFMAADSVKTMKNARRIGMSWMTLCLGGAVTIGYLGISYYYKHPEIASVVNKDNEMIFIELIKQLFNPWVVGVLLSAILAAVMSTLSAQLLMSSSTLTQDFYKAYFRRSASQKELVWTGRFAVLLISLIAIIIAYDPDSKILALVAHAWAGFGAAFGPAILFTLFWRKTTGMGTFAGVLVGAVTVIVWPILFGDTVYEIIPGFLFSSIAIYLVSNYGKQASTEMIEKFDTADALYHKEK
ncbi:sodium/proline symporter PutP [Myroides odoratimimus]|uniref:Sodium/proline symporter n=3 Tax=Myroides odoratimimus TaxID=76832 RepID=A0A0S7EEG6_9FLAO|nr:MULTISPECIES: sodium/proline symporter PutP [Myroides]AJA67660.1 sodium/proline symporter [Myroides sp. A21]ALU24955.1 proline:sodium symporter PutP [Myroides odoratimimus]EHO05826.1 sodium/proline symporter [Myroides odoratimimus CCUG 10230]EHO06342.1 sodium/proline symporter [Myroides odoratimimus CIP 101113]EHO06501.1 sodium/proline symporter [Myroides odoratimimus CCUG 12901]